MIYFNNAATSYPKPKVVIDAVQKFMTEGGFSLGRGTNSTLSVSDMITKTRAILARMFNGPSDGVILTHNATGALNLGIHGFLCEGDHVITSEMEHNSVLRPLRNLQQRNGVDVSIVECSEDGFVDPENITSAIQEHTKLICLTHASNVTGSIQPIKEVGIIAQENDITFLVDSAQSAGVLPIDMKRLNIDMLVFTGHKSLFGPQGTGGIIINEGVEEHLVPIIQGGTGIISDEPSHENLPLPDRFEAGTHNSHGLAGLKAGIEFIEHTGLAKIRNHEIALTRKFLNGLSEIDGVSLYGPSNPDTQLSVVSINLDTFPPDDLGYILDTSFGVICRTGLHCAPLAHKRIGSYADGGTVRFGLGYFNTLEEVETVLGCIEQIRKV